MTALAEQSLSMLLATGSRFRAVNFKRCFMNVSDFSTSRYLRKEDCGNGILLTIQSVQEEMVGQGASAKKKPILYFVETITPQGKPIKPMVLNPTNAKLIAQFTGIATDVERGWVGVKIVAYWNPAVNNPQPGGTPGGISVRAPRNQPARPPIQQPRPVTPMNDVPSQAPAQFVPPDAGITFPNAAPASAPPVVYGESVPYGYDEQGGGLDGQGEGDTY
jgi:hypothetical protein